MEGRLFGVRCPGLSGSHERVPEGKPSFERPQGPYEAEEGEVMSLGISPDQGPAQEQDVEEQPAVQSGEKTNGPDQRGNPPEAI